jgi:putative SOS response-associated peptidase YedK
MPQSAGPRDYERAYNARYEIAHLNEPYASPWINKQLCVVPMQAFYAPSHASGSLVLHRISRSDNSWFGVAGLWEVRSGRAGDMFSFAVLSVDATDHPFMGGFYKDDEEKRMPAVLSDQQMLSFLEAKTDSDIKKLIGSFDSEGWLSTPLEQAWRKA